MNFQHFKFFQFNVFPSFIFLLEIFRCPSSFFYLLDYVKKKTPRGPAMMLKPPKPLEPPKPLKSLTLLKPLKPLKPPKPLKQLKLSKLLIPQKPNHPETLWSMAK